MQALETVVVQFKDSGQQPKLADPDQYRERAEECVRLAQDAPAHQRPILLEIAQTWLRLADATVTESSLMSRDGAKKGGSPST
jgi:hypothetical protein